MATTTTTVLDISILTEALSTVAIPSHQAKSVVSQFSNKDSIAGLNTRTRQYFPNSDLGAATTATEGTDFSTVTSLALGTAVTLTPTEAAVALAQITRRAVERSVITSASGDAFDAAFRSGNLSAAVSILMPHAERLAGMVIEKMEDDHANLLSGFSNTVGSTGVDLTVANMITAQYTLKTLEPMHEDWVYVLTPNQVNELRLEIGATSGGLGGAVWFNQGDLSFFNIKPDAARNGYVGTFMNVPVYEYAHSLRTTANGGADVAGALMCVGRGSPASPGYQPGAIAFCEGNPIRFDMDRDASARDAELMCVWEYAVAELDDANGVSIITDA